MKYKYVQSHLVPVQGASVVHDVHGTAVQHISQTSHFVWSDGIHRVCRNNKEMKVYSLLLSLSVKTVDSSDL